MKKALFMVAGAIAALGFPSCSSDDLAPDVAQKDEVRYMKISISGQGTAGSRAEGDATETTPEFENGTDDENEVAAIRLLFYDSTGKYIGENRDNTGWKEYVENTTGTNTNVSRTKIVSVGIKNGQSVPAYVVAILNPVDYSSFENGDYTTMESLRNVYRSNYITATGKYAMSNSTYYDTTTGNKISGTAIDDEQIYTSEKEAEDGAAVDIYVERYAAKVQFAFDKEIAQVVKAKNVDAYKGASKVSVALTFVPEAWTVNAEEHSTSIIKKFSSNGSPDVPNLATVNAALAPWTLWNDPGNFRSYWACSPAYYDTEFPSVADNIMDETDGEAGKPLAGIYSLAYYSYNQITGSSSTSRGKGTTAFTKTNNVYPCRYTFENTTSADAFESDNPNACVASLLIVGKYGIKYNKKDYENNTFYMYNSLFYFDQAPTDETNAPVMLDKLLDDQTVLFIKKEDNTYEKLSANNANTLKSSFEIEHPAKTVRDTNDELPVPQNNVALQLKEVPGSALYYRANGTTTFTAVTTEVLTTINSMLWLQLGVIEKFTNGKAYFSIPIQHLRLSENTPDKDKPVVNENNATVNWANARVGDFGIVRNHVYTLEVSEIAGLGTGINDPDYPIVPPVTLSNQLIKFRINILNWRVVPTQGGIKL